MPVRLPLAAHHPRFASAVRRADRIVRWVAFELLLVSALATGINWLLARFA